MYSHRMWVWLGCECASQILPVMRTSCTRTHPRPSVTDRPQLMSLMCWRSPCDSLWDRMTVCHGESFSSCEVREKKHDSNGCVRHVVIVKQWSKYACWKLTIILYANQRSMLELVLNQHSMHFVWSALWSSKHLTNCSWSTKLVAWNHDRCQPSEWLVKCLQLRLLTGKF